MERFCVFFFFGAEVFNPGCVVGVEKFVIWTHQFLHPKKNEYWTPPKLVVCKWFSFSKLVFLGSMFVFLGLYIISFSGVCVNHGKEVTGILGLSRSDEQRQQNLYAHSILLIRSWGSLWCFIIIPIRGFSPTNPWVFLLKMSILGCFGGTTILGNTHTTG